MINRQSFTPLYIQIAQMLMQDIEGGAIAFGAQLPSERDLAVRFNVSRLTARQAIDELVKRGIAYRQQGRGTFVARPRIRESSGLISFSDELKSRGFVPVSRVLVQRMVVPPPSVSAKLQLREAGVQVLQLDRIRLANQEPVAVEYAYVNAELLPGIDAHDYSTRSLFDVMRGQFGVQPAWAEAEVEARLATRQEAEWLNLDTRTAVLVAHRMTYTEAFQPIEMVDSIYPGDRFPIYTGRQRVLTQLE
jgi:GntR family transcriptional regulator